MAKMYPKLPPRNSQQAEITVFEALSNGLSDRYHVFYGKRFFFRPKGYSKRIVEGELDFLILDPERGGYLVLEVKGGIKIERSSAGKWSSTDHDGNTHGINDPGRQAQGAAHDIYKYLEKELPSLKSLSFGWGVAFPSVEYTTRLDPALPEKLVMDSKGVEDPIGTIERIFDFSSIKSAPLSEAQIREFIQLMSRGLSLVRSLDQRIQEDEIGLVRLTGEQIRMLDVVEENTRVAVKGGAGTGKTLVAMEKARRLSDEGKKVLFLCYNKNLARWLAKKADGFTVVHFHKFCRDTISEAGLPWKVSGYGGDEKFWHSDVPELLVEALDKLPDTRFDAVIVDEGQDFWELEWISIEKLLKSSAESHFYIFYDPNQQIYGGSFADGLKMVNTTLSDNCRNTKKIAVFCADLIGQKPKVKEDAPGGAEVRLIQCSDRPDPNDPSAPPSNNEKCMTDSVNSLLQHFHIEGKVPPNKITVLIASSMRKSPVWAHRRFGNLTLSKLDFDKFTRGNDVQCTTLESFKGLEADVIIVCEVDRRRANWDPHRLYVACSRAKHVLAVVEYAT